MRLDIHTSITGRTAVEEYQSTPPEERQYLSYKIIDVVINFNTKTGRQILHDLRFNHINNYYASANATERAARAASVGEAKAKEESNLELETKYAERKNQLLNSAALSFVYYAQNVASPKLKAIGYERAANAMIDHTLWPSAADLFKKASRYWMESALITKDSGDFDNAMLMIGASKKLEAKAKQNAEKVVKDMEELVRDSQKKQAS